MRGEAKHTTWTDVLIVLMNVGIRVMQYVVLDLPGKCICADEVDRITHQRVDPGLIGIRSVIRIMHNRQSDSRKAEAHHEDGYQHEPGIGNKPGKYQHVRTKVQGEHEDTLEDHLTVTMPLDIVLFKVRIHPLLQCS